MLHEDEKEKPVKPVFYRLFFMWRKKPWQQISDRSGGDRRKKKLTKTIYILRTENATASGKNRQKVDDIFV